jgi:hypothetical protein
MKTTITFRGIEFDVDYYFQPEEKATYEYSGCPPCVEEINEITHNGTDFTEFLEEHEYEIAEIIYEQEHI